MGDKTQDGLTDREREIGCTISDVWPIDSQILEENAIERNRENRWRFYNVSQADRENLERGKGKMTRDERCIHRFDEKDQECVKCGMPKDQFLSGKRQKPDSYLAQDAENQFRAIFFQNGDYRESGYMIKTFTAVGPVNDDLEFPFFFIWMAGKAQKLEYESQDEAMIDRVKLLIQIESYYFQPPNKKR